MVDFLVEFWSVKGYLGQQKTFLKRTNFNAQNKTSFIYDKIIKTIINDFYLFFKYACLRESSNNHLIEVNTDNLDFYFHFI